MWINNQRTGWPRPDVSEMNISSGHSNSLTLLTFNCLPNVAKSINDGSAHFLFGLHNHVNFQITPSMDIDMVSKIWIETSTKILLLQFEIQGRLQKHEL